MKEKEAATGCKRPLRGVTVPIPTNDLKCHAGLIANVPVVRSLENLSVLGDNGFKALN